MSYLCQACHEPAPPGQKRLLHVQQRTVTKRAVQVTDQWTGKLRLVVEACPPRTEIAVETPVCAGCKRRLDGGANLNDLIRFHRHQQADLAAAERQLTEPIRPTIINVPHYTTKRVMMGRTA